MKRTSHMNSRINPSRPATWTNGCDPRCPGPSLGHIIDMSCHIICYQAVFPVISYAALLVTKRPSFITNKIKLHEALHKI